MIVAPARPVPLAELVRLGLYWFATSFHWGALLTVLIPAEILRFVPESQKGAYLGGLFSAGAVLAMVASPISGALSDRSTLPMGRRRPFVLAGALVNCLGLVGMRYAPTYLAYSGSYMIVQAANNFAGGAFNGLIPDKVPPAQRGMVWGIWGFMLWRGTTGGVFFPAPRGGGGHRAAVYGFAAGGRG